jgi:hypothetical protein
MIRARAADNELFDRACDLVEAATAIRRCAQDPAAAPALPAVLGCLEEALNELAGASTAMRQVAADGAPCRREVVQRMERGLDNLRTALEDAGTASRAAQALAARRLAAENGRSRR